MRNLILLTLALTTTSLQATNLLSNGDFETGSLGPWTTTSSPSFPIANTCNNSFAVQSTGVGCIAGSSPTSGLYAAYSSMSLNNSPTDNYQVSNTLRQDFLVTNSVASAILSWSETAIWDGLGTFRGVNVLTQLYFGNTFLTNRFTTINPNVNGQYDWTNQTWNLTPWVNSFVGQTLTIEFRAQAFNNLANTYNTRLSVGLDNIALTVPTQVPEPAPLATVISSLCVGALALKFKKKR